MTEIIETKFTEALSERYLAYALSTIMSRSLPDVRDGLKPVHRRILYAMLQLKMDPKAAYKKCARVVGDVIGKYHPHGDTAVYDALVRLAQDFSIRYPLIQGQGNFGSIDGDNAAAMRYTESRLTEIALYLLKDLDEDTVNFKSTYDDQDSEPCLLPSYFPNLLANGTEGIAVGMATSIPPHNLSELCDASLALLAKPETTVADLMQHIQGPDLPTGGIINETKENIIKAYETGRGSFKVRAVWHREELPRNTYQIVITQMPYQVQKSKLIEKIAELFKDKKLPLIDDFYDDSAENIALIIKPRNASISAEAIMESLFKQTDLEYRVSLNMNVLDSNSVPRVMSLKEVLEEFLKHKEVVILRRSKFRLDKINHRLEILAGFLIAYLNLDEVIRIIRYEDEPKEELIKIFSLTDVQSEAILNMRLKSLRKLEEMTIKKEHQELTEAKANLEDIISNPLTLKKVIKTEINEVKQKFGLKTEIGARRTIIENIALSSSAIAIDIESFIAKEPLTIICSQLGWIRALKGHNLSLENIRYKDGDGQRFIIELFTTDKVIIFTQTGKFYTIPAHTMSVTRGDGDPLNTLIELERDEQVIDIQSYIPNRKLLLVSRAGKGFIVSSNEVLAQTKMGKKIMNLGEGDEAIMAKLIDPSHDLIALLGTTRKLLIFKIEEISEMKRGQGVQLQRYQDGKLSALKLFSSEEGLSWNYLGQERREKKLTPWIGKRGQIGKIPPAGLARNNKFD
jgi:topoisomerase-4 subunit A